MKQKTVFSALAAGALAAGLSLGTSLTQAAPTVILDGTTVTRIENLGVPDDQGGTTFYDVDFRFATAYTVYGSGLDGFPFNGLNAEEDAFAVLVSINEALDANIPVPSSAGVPSQGIYYIGAEEDSGAVAAVGGEFLGAAGWEACQPPNCIAGTSVLPANDSVTYADLSPAGSDPCAGLVACFEDVPDSYWSASQIETIADLGITSGCDETHYCPTDPVNRAQMAVFVERGMRGGGYDPGPGVGNIFEDVPAGYWAGGWIELLFMDGITGGCDATHYCPSQLTTRAEMAVFLLRAKYGMDYAPPTPVGVFNDVAVTYWAAGWIEQLAAEGITSGCGGGNYCPADPVNRDQMAVFLVRTFQLQ